MIRCELDTGFLPAVQWNRAYEAAVDTSTESGRVSIGLWRQNQPMARRELQILPERDSARNFQYIERLLKFMLWAYGGNRILFSGPDCLLQRLKHYYAETSAGRFDSETVGRKIFGSPIQIEKRTAAEIPEPDRQENRIGGHLEGCRIGFDLGGSDRKCAALMDGEVVFSEEVKWDPYFQSNPQYHYDGIMDSLRRAAAHLPRVDAIGGSAAGVYVNNEVRVSSLFRGVSPMDFESSVRRIFHRLKAEWNHVPFEVVNDGEVTALAGAMSLNDRAILGVSMGTSMAAGYVTPEGTLTSRLNELAFVPVDYRADGPVDEWSGDRGCGVQFFSQQGAARLAAAAGLTFPQEVPLAERLLDIQRLTAAGDRRARRIYETIGICFGYAVARFAEFYDFRNLLLLGRVLSGSGGQVIIENTEKVLQTEFPELAEKIKIRTLDEQGKRHGQAVAAAGLPSLSEKSSGK